MYTLTIGRRFKGVVESFEAASKIYSDLRDESYEGASTFPWGKIKLGSKLVADISYNGRVWEK
jgi:hypothetical protein